MKKKVLPRLTDFFKNYLNTWVVFGMDLILSVLASFIILSLTSYISKDPRYDGQFALVWILASFAGSFLMFCIIRSHRLVIRHMVLKDMYRISLAALGKVVIMGVALLISGLWFRALLFLLLFIDFAFSAFLMASSRVVMVVIYDAIQHNIKEGSNYVRVFVYGTLDKSVALATRLYESVHYKVIGFIIPSDSGQPDSLSMNGYPVLKFSDKDEVDEYVNDYSVGAVLFATESDVKAEQDGLVKYAISNGIKVLIAPAIDEVVGGGIIKSQIREINITDLLGREEIKISMDAIVRQFNNSVVMVTGAAGSIGSELCRQLAGFGPKKLILFDNGETPMHNLRLELEENFPNLDFVPIIGDVRLPARLDYAFSKWKPNVVFHAAAYKHVPLMEENPCEAVLVNVCGSRNVADKCLQYGVDKMVMISTDKAVNPTNVMGCSKRLAEIYVQSLGLSVARGEKEGKTKFVTTRFGNVLGSNGSVIPRFKQQIEKGGPVTVTHPEINRFFMTIPEACRLVMEAATISTGNQIVVFDMGQPVKIVDLARHMIELAGFVPDKDIKIEFTGLRPGEKLYEEVLANAENTDETSHDRIRVAHVREYDNEEAKSAIAELELLALEVKIPELVAKLKEIVPEYDCKWKQ